MFKNDLFEGQGVFTNLQGRKYDGDWEAGKMHGKGKLRLPNQSVYEGWFESDLKHGIGKFTWPGGKKFYNGGWKEGKRHGKGHMWVEGRERNKEAVEFDNGV